MKKLFLLMFLPIIFGFTYLNHSVEKNNSFQESMACCTEVASNNQSDSDRIHVKVTSCVAYIQAPEEHDKASARACAKAQARAQAAVAILDAMR